MREREQMISQLEWANAELVSSGKCAHWFRDCDAITKKVTEGVNGFLMQELLVASGHCDVGAVELFRQGAWGEHDWGLCM
jgi:hypothetical protein